MVLIYCTYVQRIHFSEGFSVCIGVFQYLLFCVGFNVRQPEKREETSQKMAFQELWERQQNNPAGDL